MNRNETYYWMAEELLPEGDRTIRDDISSSQLVTISTEGEIICATTTLGRVDTGLVTTVGEDEYQVRVEVFTVLSPGEFVVEYAQSTCGWAADMIADAAQNRSQEVLAQPGTVLGAFSDSAGSSARPLAARQLTGRGFTARYGLLVSPWVWPDGVPHMLEQPGKVTSFGPEDFIPPELGRFTVPLQLLMLTDVEYEYATTYSVAALQQQLAAGQVDITDPKRVLPD